MDFLMLQDPAVYIQCYQSLAKAMFEIIEISPKKKKSTIPVLFGGITGKLRVI